MYATWSEHMRELFPEGLLIMFDSLLQVQLTGTGTPVPFWFLVDNPVLVVPYTSMFKFGISSCPNTLNWFQNSENFILAETWNKMCTT